MQYYLHHTIVLIVFVKFRCFLNARRALLEADSSSVRRLTTIQLHELDSDARILLMGRSDQAEGKRRQASVVVTRSVVLPLTAKELSPLYGELYNY
jgi:hypothetical protein